jgi:hypothetical protein
MGDDRYYHRQRETHCRELAAAATNPRIRELHEELATLHAREAGGLVLVEPTAAAA